MQKHANRWRVCFCIHTCAHTHTHSEIWLPKQMCTQTQAHTQGNGKTERRRGADDLKMWAHAHRKWQANRCTQTHGISARGERVTPVSAPSQGTEGPVCTGLGSRPHEAQSGGGERERERDGGGEWGKEGEQMGQPSGGWRKSEGDEKKREGALGRERERESWRGVWGGGSFMGNIRVCVCLCVCVCVCVQME